MKLQIDNKYIYSLIIFIIIITTSIPNGYEVSYPLAILSLIMYKNYLKYNINNKALIYLICFILISILYVFMGYGYFSTFRNVAWLYFIMIISCLYTYIIPHLSFSQLTNLHKVIISCAVVSILGTIFIIIIDPISIRTLGFGETDNIETIELSTSYYKRGMISYALAHSMAILPPILTVLLIERKKLIERIIYAVMFVLILYIFFVGLITTSMLSSIIGTIAIIGYYLSKNKYTKIIFMILLPILLIFIDIAFLESIINYLLSITESNMMASKLNDILNFLKGDQTYQIDYRNDLHNLSKDAFFDNPLLGMADKEKIGNHSLILDYLAIYGLLGCLPLFLSVIYIIKIHIKGAPKFYKGLFIVLTIPYMILFYSKSGVFLGTYYFFLAIILPISFHLIIKEKLFNKQVINT